jgi:hypothetical protein
MQVPQYASESTLQPPSRGLAVRQPFLLLRIGFLMHACALAEETENPQKKRKKKGSLFKKQKPPLIRTSFH